MCTLLTSLLTITFYFAQLAGIAGLGDTLHYTCGLIHNVVPGPVR